MKRFVQLLKKEFEHVFGPSGTSLNFGAIPYRDGELMEFRVNNSALTALGWQPFCSLEKGLELTIGERRT